MPRTASPFRPTSSKRKLQVGTLLELPEVAEERLHAGHATPHQRRARGELRHQAGCAERDRGANPESQGEQQRCEDEQGDEKSELEVGVHGHY